ncbi:unnamed protein product [Nyctereutes procyonoides]|uniref:(raccoon dog) hypothetical protein n=1 Tax=Nyctereutes procyonoides TaxID=34880 RepID=A0A811XVN7_NYCPR|nr:unnamed protein product [Nyctereutes procyonoides]
MCLQPHGSPRSLLGPPVLVSVSRPGSTSGCGSVSEPISVELSVHLRLRRAAGCRAAVWPLAWGAISWALGELSRLADRTSDSRPRLSASGWRAGRAIRAVSPVSAGWGWGSPGGGEWLEGLGGLGKGVPLGLQTRAASPLGVSQRPHTHILSPRVPGSHTHHPAPTSTVPSLTPYPHPRPTHLRALRWPFRRLGPLLPGPEGLRRPWGTGAAGREGPGLIGDPGNNEGCEAGEAGGLIGPRSGLAFVWDKALLPAVRFPQPNSDVRRDAQRSERAPALRMLEEF